MFSKSATITGAHTITGPSQQYGILVCDGATLTLAGGATITPEAATSHTILNTGIHEGEEPTWTTGNFVLAGGTIRGNGVNGNAIAAQAGTVTINSGSITNIGTRGVKAECVATVVINGGTIGDANTDTKPVLYVADAGAITVNGGDFCGKFDVKSGATGTITIPGTSTATFDRDQTAFCALGYLTKLNSGDPARYEVVAAVAVTGVTLSESTVTIAPDATTNLTATVAPTGADVKEAAWSTSAAGVATVADGVVTAVAAGKATITYTVVDYYNTTNSASCEVTVAVPTPPEPEPIDPTDPESKVEVKAETKEAAEAAVKVSVPDAVKDVVDETTYNGYFKKTATETKPGSKTWNVKAELDPEAIDLEEQTEELAGDLTDTAATITTKAGLFYSVDEAATLEGGVAGLTEHAGTGERVLGDGKAQSIPKSAFTNSGFFKLHISTKQK